MESDLQMELLRCETTMTDGELLMDELDSEDRFGCIQWCCFFDAGDPC